MCRASGYVGCLEGLTLIAATAPGSLIAICDYRDGTGDIVLIEDASDAESECSADGSISPSRVVGVAQLP